MTKKRGGYRLGAGRKVGSLDPINKLRIKTEKEMQRRIMKNVNKLINAQMSLAKGCSFLYRIDKDEDGKGKKAELVTSKKEILGHFDGKYDDDDSVYYYITAQKPDNGAIKDMIDRVYGKPIQKTEVTGKDGKDLVPISEEKKEQINKILSDMQL